MTREVVFDGLEPADIRSKVEKQEQLRVPFGVDQRIGQLINECRQVNPNSRPSFDKIVNILESFLWEGQIATNNMHHFYIMKNTKS